MMRAQESVGTDKIVYSDTDLIARILAGQHQLFELLVRRNNAKIYRVGRSFGFGHCDTEDLMQETHIDAFLHLPSFEQRSTYTTWVMRLMINRCGQRLRKNKVRLEVVREDRNGLKEPTASSSDPAALAINKELGLLMEQCVLELPINYRIVFTLRELEHLNVAQTAQILGISEVNVKVRLNRAKAMLRERLKVV